VIAARRPWWRKKRWAAALALWLPLLYAASAGPVSYAVGRAWVRPQTALALYRPVAAPIEEIRLWEWWAALMSTG
jgi:hypothetical protein